MLSGLHRILNNFPTRSAMEQQDFFPLDCEVRSNPAVTLTDNLLSSRYRVGGSGFE